MSRNPPERKITRTSLQKSDVRFRAISDALPLGIFVSDTHGNCLYTNLAYQKITGLSFARTLGSNWSAALHPDDLDRVLAEWHHAAQNFLPLHSEARFVRKDASVVWTRLNTAVMRIDTQIHGYVQTVEDISERKVAERQLRLAEEALFDEKERAQITLNSIGDAVLCTDLKANISYLNAVAETMTGWSREEALGRPLTDVFKIVVGATLRKASFNPALRAMQEGRAIKLDPESILLRRDGSELAVEDTSSPIHNRSGQVTGAVIVFHDVSALRTTIAEMAHLAQHDFLTGLPNRLLLTERLSQAIGLAHRRRHKVALLFLDLDYFKKINDEFGHVAGDQLLQAVALRLSSCVRTTDTVCRQGGDEFVILLAEIERQQDASQVAEKLLKACTAAYVIGEHELHAGLSIGISVYPDDGSTADSLMQNADTAMYHAKSAGRNNFQFFNVAASTNSVRRLSGM